MTLNGSFNSWVLQLNYCNTHENMNTINYIVPWKYFLRYWTWIFKLTRYTGLPSSKCSSYIWIIDDIETIIIIGIIGRLCWVDSLKIFTLLEVTVPPSYCFNWNTFSIKLAGKFSVESVTEDHTIKHLLCCVENDWVNIFCWLKGVFIPRLQRFILCMNFYSNSFNIKNLHFSLIKCHSCTKKIYSSSNYKI